MNTAGFILIVILALGVVISAVNFLQLSGEEQTEKIRQWLLQAVIAAEKEYGSGTGRLKLSTVYDLFVRTFPQMARIVPFGKFSELVDEALQQMNTLLADNAKIAGIITGIKG